MDNNRSKCWHLVDGDYINNDLDYELGHKLIKKRERMVNIISKVGFGTLTFALMLIVLQVVAKIRI